MVKASALIAVLAVPLFLWFDRPHTHAVRGPDPVAELLRVELGGLEQSVLIRGTDRSNPVLLFLHGGPGMPATFLAHRMPHIERDFVVVHWDQRGAGRSYREDLDWSTLSVEAVLADALDLTDTLRARFGRERVVLLGHSWGSYLGMLLAWRHPDRISHYVGVGQVADRAREAELQRRFLMDTASAEGDVEALELLEREGPAAHESLLFRYGAELAGATSFWPLVWMGLTAPEYTVLDALKVARGSSLSSRHMQWNAIDRPLMEAVDSVAVPVTFVMGGRDWTTPHPLARAFFRRLQAPSKQWVWFEDAAHFPFLSEPERFARALREAVVMQGRDAG